MKSMIIISMFLISVISCYSANNVKPQQNDTICIYKVIKIDKTRKAKNGTNKAYIILVQDIKTDSIKVVVSLRSNNKTMERIKRGEYYALKLDSYYEIDYFITTGIKFSVHIEDITIHIPANDNTYNIFTTNDLNGLYYIPEDRRVKF
jgi:hypothetical protein